MRVVCSVRLSGEVMARPKLSLKENVCESLLDCWTPFGSEEGPGLKYHA